MTVEYRRYRAAGHKLKHSRSGAQDGYARGDCECGWTFTGWTHWRADVIRSHNNHLWDVLEAKGWKVFTVNQHWECFAPTAVAAAMWRARERRIPGLYADRQTPLPIADNAWLIDGKRYAVEESKA